MQNGKKKKTWGRQVYIIKNMHDNFKQVQYLVIRIISVSVQAWEAYCFKTLLACARPVTQRLAKP